MIRESVALPGQVVLGTDSHTCSAGALNCFAYGVVNTEIATIWEHNEVAGRVPQTVRVRLTGSLSPSRTAKDVMLHLARQGKRDGVFTGKVIEFVGPGLATLAFEEQAVLSNMAVECNALTAVMEPTESMIRYLEERRGISRADIEAGLIYPDDDSEVDALVELDLGLVEHSWRLRGTPETASPWRRFAEPGSIWPMPVRVQPET